MTKPSQQKIAAALGDGQISSADLRKLIGETEQALAEAEATAHAERKKALDPIASPDFEKAEQLVWSAQLWRERMRSSLSQLGQRLANVEAAETSTRWEAPAGEHRRLRGVELSARGLDSFGISAPPLTETIKLPGWKQSDRMIWPPPQVPLAVLVAESMRPPDDPRFGPNWGAAREQDMAGGLRPKRVGPRRRKSARQKVGVLTRRVCDAELWTGLLVRHRLDPPAFKEFKGDPIAAHRPAPTPLLEVNPAERLRGSRQLRGCRGLPRLRW
jgi:hypothetical protein